MAKGALEDRFAHLLICLQAVMDDRVGWRKRAMGWGGEGGGSTEVDYKK